ncbi:MAG: hypothetical protein KGL39_04415 [Patescibacteria group bacterium]|nr:hypothetical protein [Patescibacteria group bacterium]
MSATALPNLDNLTAKEEEARNLTAFPPGSNTGGVFTGLSKAATASNATGATAPSVTTPSFPTTGTAVTNSTGYDVAVYLYGGTVTEVQIGSTEVGTGDGTFILPAGSTITITFTGSPSWVWKAANALPNTPAGYVEVAIGGNLCKIPYYNA